MLHLKSFTFNPFQENTYLLYDDSKTTFIIDPGNSDTQENTMLQTFITQNGLKPARLLLTHAHIDHVMGNRFIFDTYGLLPEVNAADLFFIDRMVESGKLYGVPCEQSPKPEKYINEGDVIKLGEYVFQCLHTPGHSPGSISFFNEQNKILICGDVLFNGSIGRSDLPMGDHDTLISSIKIKLFPLGDQVKVYSGHGPPTTIGREKKTNPFLT
jgi:hydroxyacylglutathione hydrolase